jgi:hypothetical protein
MGMFNKTNLALRLAAILGTTSVAHANHELYRAPAESTSKHQVAPHGPFAANAFVPSRNGNAGLDRDDPPGSQFQSQGGIDDPY